MRYIGISLIEWKTRTQTNAKTKGKQKISFFFVELQNSSVFSFVRCIKKRKKNVNPNWEEQHEKNG